MAATTLAKDRGVRVIATTRQVAKRAALEANGADHVIVDDGSIAGAVRALVPGGADALLVLVGTNTIVDSLQALSPAANVCLTGVLEAVWDYDAARLAAEARGVTFHRYTSSVINRIDYGTIFQTIVDGVESGRYHLNLDRTFPLANIVEAHRYMEANRATGKVVGLP
jgi:NADPH:quinone reductase